jgi:hypothetical protein
MRPEIVEENKKLFEEYRGQIEMDNWKWYGGPIHFKCVECGKYCSSMTFGFFKNDPTKVKCYDCQQLK